MLSLNFLTQHSQNWFQIQKLYPWRSFLTRYGSHPFFIWDVSLIEYYMQVCTALYPFPPNTLLVDYDHVMLCFCSSVCVIWTAAVEWRPMGRFWAYLWSLMMLSVAGDTPPRISFRTQEMLTSALFLIEKYTFTSHITSSCSERKHSLCWSWCQSGEHGRKKNCNSRSHPITDEPARVFTPLETNGGF